MNMFEVYCNGSKPRGFRPATLCMDVDELTKYVSCSLKADDAELLCAQFDIDVPDNKQSTAKKLASRYLAEGLHSHSAFVRARVARQARLKELGSVRSSRQVSQQATPSVSVSVPRARAARTADATEADSHASDIAALEAQLAALLRKTSKTPKASKAV